MEQPPSTVRRAATAAVGAAAAAGLSYGLWRLAKKHAASSAAKGAGGCGLRIRVLFGSVSGTSELWARSLAAELEAELGGAKGLDRAPAVVIEDLAGFHFDSLLPAPRRGDAEVVLVLLSTQAEGAPPPLCAHFVDLLEDHVHDFRVGQDALAHLAFAVVGFGSSEYEPTRHYCTAAARVDQAFGALSGFRILPLRLVTDTKDPAAQLRPWRRAVMGKLRKLARDEMPTAAAPPPQRLLPRQPQEEDGSESDGSSTTVSEKAKGGGASDVEELTESCAGTVHTKEPEMLTSKQKASLTKEGYKLIGSHSAVKLCRWTKHHLRGRGGCYKHSFYGITSYQCMEATPSLACANKCVFCWRHHKNPVGTSWKWKQDEPGAIVAQGIDLHRQMIRECKGVPGVMPERLQDAMTVQHCALSLVGEPIMYPRINELVGELHRRHISTFLVTNAQFPDAIQTLVPVTQLYVSVDAPTKESLKEVDRPLFSDFWERYLGSLTALRDKRQRTVYRLTLVKDHNMSDPAEYSKLVALGEPDLIEIKSVTFCGESKASNLSISNTPWHEEVKAFAEAMLAAEGLADKYELACEHQHSCIILLAQKKYKIEGQWHTWIDYDRFHELVAAGEEFGAMDYLAPTPEWALYGAEEAGFDPKDKRHFHNRTVKRAKAGQLSEEQLRQYPSDPAQA